MRRGEIPGHGAERLFPAEVGMTLETTTSSDYPIPPPREITSTARRAGSIDPRGVISPLPRISFGHTFTGVELIRPLSSFAYGLGVSRSIMLPQSAATPAVNVDFAAVFKSYPVPIHRTLLIVYSHAATKMYSCTSRRSREPDMRRCTIGNGYGSSFSPDGTGRPPRRTSR